MADGGAPTQEARVEMLETRLNIVLSLMALKEKISARKESWTGPGGVCKTVGSAYVDAYNGFKNTHSSQAAWDNFMTQIGFSVLSVCCAGTLGLIFAPPIKPFRLPTRIDPVNLRFGQQFQFYTNPRPTRWNLKGIREIPAPALQDAIKTTVSEGLDVPGYSMKRGSR